MKSAILTVYTEDTGLCENLDEILVHKIATNETIDYVKLILKRISTKSEIIDAIIKHDAHAIIEKIYSLCDKNDVNFIFIIGRNLPYLSCKLSENDIAEMIEQIVDKEYFKKFASLISKIKAKLEFKYHRVICGIRKKTLIINLFDLYEEALITCCNIIMTTLKQQINLTVELNRFRTEVKSLEERQCYVAHFANRLISKISFINQVDDDKIKKIKEILNYFMSEVTNAFKQLEESFFSSDKSTEKTIDEREMSLLDNLEKIYSLCESNLEEIDVANEYTASKEFSSPVKTIVKMDANKNTIVKESSSSSDAMTKESNISNQATIDEKSLSSPIIMNKLNIAYHVTVDYKGSSASSDAMTKEIINISNQAIIDKAFFSLSDAMTKKTNILNQAVISDDKLSSSFRKIRFDEFDILPPAIFDKQSFTDTFSDTMSIDKNFSSSSENMDENSSSSPENMDEHFKSTTIDDKESSPENMDEHFKSTTIDDKESLLENMNKHFTLTTIDDKESSPENMNEMDLKDIVSNTQYPMISLDEAFSIMRKVIKFNINERQFDKVNIYDAYGRILCQTIYSDCNVPAFRVSTKHGFAILASDGQGIRTVLNEITNTPVSLKSGTCVWVKSGARIPDETTAVVPVKDAKRIIDNNNVITKSVMITIKPEFGQNIKDIGSDIRKDKLIIQAFTRIGPAELGLLAVTGRTQVIVATRASVGILSIGDLLEEPGNSLTAGYVYDSNRISLIALLKNKGFDSILDCGIVADNMPAIIMRIKEVLQKADVLVTIGCSSDNDQLKEILTGYFNATIHFGNVDVKPGKSTTFGTLKFEDKIKYFLCLPKNPVSTLITAHLFLVTLLNGLHRTREMTPRIMPVCINQRYILHSRPRLAWAILQWNEEENFARAFAKESLVRNKLHSSQSANALIILPRETINAKAMHPAFVNALAINISK